MTMRCAWLAALWGCLALAGFAQPMPDETWLTVRVVKDDGTPFPARQVTLHRVNARSRVALRNILNSDGNAVTFSGLEPSTIELVLTLSLSGIEDGPKSITLLPGPNEFTWTLPPLVRVNGRLLLQEKLAAEANTVQAYLLHADKGATSLPATLRRGSFSVGPLFPGEYRLLLLTNAGFAVTALTVPREEERDDGKSRISVPLQPAGAVEIQVKDADGRELADATVTLRRAVETGRMVAVTARTDKEGKAAIPPLPPGEWHWTAVASRYKAGAGKLDVKADGPNTCAITLELVAK